MIESAIAFHSHGFKLEGVMASPEGLGPFPGVVVCHPHPLYGGCMDNGVVMAVCRALVARSIVALRFNFRGVGGSQGQFGQGLAEMEDARAALSFLAAQPQADPGRLGLAGYSFGARIALGIAPKDGRVQALAALSPPVSFLSPSLLEAWRKPKLFILGSRDDFSLPDEFRHFVGDLPEPKSYQVIDGADHFWWGREEEVGRRVAAFLAESLKPKLRLI